jgi:hypothetical protein
MILYGNLQPQFVCMEKVLCDVVLRILDVFNSRNREETIQHLKSLYYVDLHLDPQFCCLRAIQLFPI